MMIATPQLTDRSLLRSCGSDMESGKEWWWCSRTPRRGLHRMPLHEPSRLSPPHRKIFLLVVVSIPGFRVRQTCRNIALFCRSLLCCAYTDWCSVIISAVSAQHAPVSKTTLLSSSFFRERKSAPLSSLLCFKACLLLVLSYHTSRFIQQMCVQSVSDANHRFHPHDLTICFNK